MLSPENVWTLLVLPHIELGFKVAVFRPAWAGYETEFARLQDLLLGRRTPPGEMIPWLADDGPVNEVCEKSDPMFHLSIKSFKQNYAVVSPRLKIIRAIAELVE